MKKLFAILMALMLVMASAAALADVPILPSDVVASAGVDVKITKSYEVDGSTSAALLPAHTVNFTVTQWKITEATDTNAWPENNIIIDPVSIDEGTSVFEDNMTLHIPSYSAPGIYWYKIDETDPHIAGVDANDTTYYLKVTVWNDNGTLKIGGVALRNQADDGAVKNEAGVITGYGEKTDTITNDYVAGDLIVSKTVEGNMADREKYFTFTVKFESTESYSVPAAEEGGEATTGYFDVNSTIKVTDAGDVTGAKYGVTSAASATALTADGAAISGSWTDKTVYLQLKHGQAVKFENIPKNVKYTVTEADYSGDGYTPDKTVATSTFTSASSENADFTNTKTLLIDTGVALDTSAYVLIMALALAGFVMMAIRRREEY